ncbi:MAG: hypothetical protein Q8R82_01935 [Hyphomonadaceae bacterium]|nr:hypothetical protein [Hyphomonadaceae bacterium]
MEFNPIFLFELLLFNGVVLAWAGYELWSVRKSVRNKPEPNSTPPDEPGHTEG